MNLSKKDILMLEERRRTALGSGGRDLDRPILDAIMHLDGPGRLTRVVRGYATIGDFLRADLTTLIGIPGMSTQTVATIQTGIDAVMAQTGSRQDDSALRGASTGHRMLVHAQQALSGREDAFCDVTLRSGVAINSVTGIQIEDGLVHLRCKAVALRTKERIHMVDAADVALVAVPG